jgi:hypothetical protein
MEGTTMKDTAVQKTARVHEKTIQKVATGEHRPRRRRHNTPQVQPTFASPVVDQRVWVKVKEIVASGHGYTRWEILDEKTMVVR